MDEILCMSKVHIYCFNKHVKTSRKKVRHDKNFMLSDLQLVGHLRHCIFFTDWSSRTTLATLQNDAKDSLTSLFTPRRIEKRTRT